MNKTAVFFSLVLAFAGISAYASTLTNITWVGVAGADLATASNWSPAPAKALSDKTGNGYRLCFTGDATPVISSAAIVYCGEIKVTAGNVHITQNISNGRFVINNTTHADYAATKMVIEVAADATLQIGTSAKRVNINNSGMSRTYVKAGAGTLIVYGDTKSMAAGWEVDGTLAASATLGSSDGNLIKVKTGGMLKILEDSTVPFRSIVDLAQGAVFDLNGKKNLIAAVTGAGTVRNGKLNLSLAGGPHRFDGRFEEMSELQLQRYTGSTKAASESEFGLILGAADTLALPGCNFEIKYDSSCTDTTLGNVANCALRFAPGIGEFYCATNKVITRPFNSYPIYCADMEGNPVVVHAELKSAIERYQRFTGPGTLVAHVVSSDNDTTTLTNDIVSVTGTLALGLSGTTLSLGNGKAAQDFDFSNPSAIEACAEGTVVFSNAAPVVYAGTLLGSGTFIFNKGATIGALGLNLGCLTMMDDTTVSGGRGSFLYGANGLRFDKPDMTLTVNGGTFISDRNTKDQSESWYAPLARGVLLGGGHRTTGTLRLTGGDVSVRDNYTYGVKKYQLDGGRLHLAHGRALLPSPSSAYTAANPHVFAFNGGEVVVSGRDGIGIDVFPDDERLLLEIGDGGASLDDEYIYSGTVEYRSAFALNKSLTVVGAGGLRQRSFGAWTYAQPLPIIGAFEGEGGASLVPTNDAARATASFFGAGDMILRNHVIDLSGCRKAYSFTPHGSGKKLTVGGGSMLTLGAATTDGQATVAINELAFESGGALFLYDFNTVGTGSQVTLASAPAASATGRVRLPVFGLSRLFRTAMPLKYGANGFQAFETSECSRTLEAGSIGFVSAKKTLTESRALDMLIVGSKCPLTLADNVAVTIGDGTGPSVLSLGMVEVNGGANAVLSFNGAEAMILCGIDGSTYLECASSVQVPLVNAAGLTVVSAPDIEYPGWRGVRLGAANAYSGVTRVGSAIIQAEHPNCFSTGDVYTIPGKCYGGGVRLACEGAVWQNNFHLSGQGIRCRRHNKRSNCETGFALGFSRNGTVAGTVSIDGFARLTTSTNPVIGAISGVVSGGKLEVYQTVGAIRLLNDNSYTGGTDVVDATLELGRGSSAGSGDIWLSNGTLRFVNDEPVVFSNEVHGVGEIVLAGAPVTFVDRSFATLPVKTLGKGTVLKFTTGYAWGDAADLAASTFKTAIVIAGDTVLTGDVTVDSLWGHGTVSGGQITVTGEIRPTDGDSVGTLDFAEMPILTGATLTVDVRNGAVDKIIVPSDFNLAGLTLTVVQIGEPVAFNRKAFLESAAGTLSGEFASVTLPAKKTRHYSVDIGAAAATLAYTKPGGLIIIR